MSIDNVADVSRRVQYTAANGQTEFPYTFPIFDEDDLVVQVDGATQTITTDYTVDGVEEDAGGDVTFVDAMAGGEIITIYSETAIQRTSDFQQNGPNLSAVMNDELDRITVVQQELREGIRRAIRFPMSSAGAASDSELSPISAWLERYMFVNSSGELEPAANLTTTTLTQSVIGDLLYPQTTAELDAGVMPTYFYYEPGDIRRYGASTALADNYTAINNAILQAYSGGAKVRVPSGTWKYQSEIVIDYSFLGPEHRGVIIEGDDPHTSVLQKNADIVGMTLITFCGLYSVRLGSEGSDTSVGLVIDTTQPPVLHNVRISDHGSHGIEILQCNCGHFNKVYITDNAGDGVKLTGSGAIQANVNVFLNCEILNNDGWGVNFGTAMNNVGFFAIQQNAGGGIKFGACFGNNITAYCENNGTNDLEFLNTCVAPSFGGNHVTLTFHNGAIVYNGTSANVNSVLLHRPGATFQPIFNTLKADRFVLSNQRTDGVEPTGTLDIRHDTNVTYDFECGNFDSEQVVDFSHANASFQLRVAVDNLLLKKVAGAAAAGQVRLGSTTQATVGAAGGASALPATPTKYWILNEGGTEYVIPMYAKS